MNVSASVHIFPLFLSSISYSCFFTMRFLNTSVFGKFVQQVEQFQCVSIFYVCIFLIEVVRALAWLDTPPSCGPVSFCTQGSIGTRPINTFP